MQRGRIGLGVLFLAAALALLGGCATRGGGLLPIAPPAAGGPAQAGPRVPARAGRDLGLRAASKPVVASIALRYNDEAGLVTLVDAMGDPSSPHFRHFLTPEEFNTRYAPTPQQHRRVLEALRAAGFTIVRTYPNRSLIDASAPADAAARFFGTRIHDFDQGRYGTRYANVTPVRVPAAIAGIVRGVELNSMIYAHDAATLPDTRTGNFIRNAGFEFKLTWWKDCDRVAISELHPYAGKRDALIGSLTDASGSVTGRQTVCQRVRIPHDGILVAHTYSVTNVKSIKEGYQEVGLMSAPGKVVAVLRKDLTNRKHWVTERWNLRKFAGRHLYVYFAVFGRGQKRFYNRMFVDNVILKGTIPTPPPSASPSPTPSPTHSPSPSPSPSPSTSPSPSPTTTPTHKPTPTPTPVGPGPGQPLTGPIRGPSRGWAPRAVANGFDFPVQHGYDGRGVTTAIVMQSKFDQSDLDRYLADNNVTRTGKVTIQDVAGGPTGADPTEGTIDIETIAGLAPGANVVALETPNLSNATILDAYQTALSNRKIGVIDSPFAECDSADPSFDNASEADAIAGAAMGMTFVAASGDTGSACFNGTTNVIGAEAPASDPHFVAVGGNESSSGVTSACPCDIDTPVAWEDHNVYFGGLTGGGVSQQWPIPTYQAGVVGSAASTTQRNVPDITMPAVDDDLRIFGTNKAIDGTSWSASIAVALLAQSVDICGRLGFANPSIYATYAKFGERKVFLDVTSGFNGGYTAGLPQGYHATRGYDNATGIGMPNGFQFATALCGRTISTL